MCFTRPYRVIDPVLKLTSHNSGLVRFNLRITRTPRRETAGAFLRPLKRRLSSRSFAIIIGSPRVRVCSIITFGRAIASWSDHLLILIAVASPLFRSFSSRLTRRETSPTSLSRRITLGWADGASPEEPSASSPDGSNLIDVWVSGDFTDISEPATRRRVPRSLVSACRRCGESGLLAELKIKSLDNYSGLIFRRVCRRGRRSRRFSRIRVSIPLPGQNKSGNPSRTSWDTWNRGGLFVPGYRNQCNNATVSIHVNTIGRGFLFTTMQRPEPDVRRAENAAGYAIMSAWRPRKSSREYPRSILGWEIARRERTSGRARDRSTMRRRRGEIDPRRRRFSYKFSRTLDLLRTEEFNLQSQYAV